MATIGRDECIVEVITGKYERLTGGDYALVYAVYNAKKDLHSFCKKFDGKRQTRKMDQQKAKLEQSVTDAVADVEQKIVSSAAAKAEAATSVESEDIVQKVNTLFCDKIKAALENPEVKLVIIDTMMSLFPSGIQSCVSPISDLLKGHFIIHVHVQNYKERLSGENVGGSLAKQLEVSGPFGPTQPLHPGGSTRAHDLKSFSSVFTDRKNKEVDGSASLSDSKKICVPQALHESAFRPHYVMTIMQTPDGDLGYTEALDQVGTFVY